MLATRGYGKDPSNVPLLIARDLQSSARDINPGTKEMYTSLSNDLQAGKPLAMVNMDGFTDKVYCPPEQRMEACIAEAVRRAVEGAFGRDPSSAEGNYWKKMVTNGTGPVAMTRQLLDTEESAFHNYYLYLVWSKYVATGERPTSNNPFTDAKPSSSSSSNLVKIQNNSTSETNTTANQSTTVQSNGGSSIFEQIFNRVFRRNR